MKREINPQESNRAEAFSMWMSSPQPMVTFLRPVGSKRPEVERVKTLDVSRLVKTSKKSGMKFIISKTDKNYKRIIVSLQHHLIIKQKQQYENYL